MNPVPRLLFNRTEWRVLGLLAVAALVAVWLIPTGLLLTSPRSDLINQFVAWRAFAADSLRAGHLPRWNPYTYAGQPFLGGFQSALFYPPNAIFLILPLDRALNFSIILQLLILGAGVYAWAARRGYHPAAAILCGVVFPLSGVVLPHVFAGHLSNLCSMAWAPWIFLGLENYGQTRRPRGLLLASAAGCLQILGGQPQYVVYTAVAAGVHALVHTLAQSSVRYRALPALMLVYVTAAALAAAQLFPGLSAAAESMRQDPLSFPFVSMFSFPPENLLTLVVPNFFGDFGDHAYWGRCYLWEMALFLGASGVVLIAVGLADRARRFLVRTDCAVAVLLFLLALGAHTPLLELLYHHVPTFDRFRGLSKFTFPALLFLTLVLGAGADALLRRRPPGRVAALGALVGGLFFGIVGFFFFSAPSSLGPLLAFVDNSGESALASSLLSDPVFIHRAGLQAATALLSAGGLLLVLSGTLFGLPRWPVLCWVPIILLPLEMLHFAATGLKMTPLEDAMPHDQQAFIAAHPGDYRTLDLPLLNNGFLLGAPDVGGNDPGVLKRYAEFMALTQGVDPAKATQYLDIHLLPPLYAMLRLRYAFVPDPQGLQVIERTDPLPRVQLLANYDVMPKKDMMFARLMDSSFDPHQTVLLESEPAPKPQPGAPGTVRLLATTTDSLTLEADTLTPTLLLLTDLYSRDWHARPLEGSVQSHYEILPANYILRAIPLAAGRHHLVVEYIPSGFHLGVAVSGVAWLAWLALAFKFRR